MSEQERKYDGILLSILQQEKQINSFFNVVFGFLRRNTDFFANQTLAEQSITSSCKANFDIFNKQKVKKEEDVRKREEKLKSKAENARTDEENVVETKVSKTKSQENLKPLEQDIPPPSNENTGQKQEPAPKGNGGTTDKYIWTQTLDELHLYIPIPKHTKGKQIKCQVKTQSLFVQILDQPPLINGKFYQKILAQQSLWILEDQKINNEMTKVIHITVQKWKNQNSWWPTPIRGDPEINTQKINPEPSSYSDIQDPETKATVGEMLFNMKQKQMGLPTSDQLKKEQVLEKFKKSHPEMDFSNCKIN